MYEGSLFEKLTGEYIHISHDEKESLYLSIANNLAYIFTTNSGSAEACLDYGKPELNDMNLSLEASLSNINTVFTDSILKYEPRLYDVNVKSSSGALNLSKIHITIIGYMRANNEDHRVEYTAVILNDGIVEVKK